MAKRAFLYIMTCWSCAKPATICFVFPRASGARKPNGVPQPLHGHGSTCRELTDAVKALDAELTTWQNSPNESWERQLRDYNEFISHLRFDSFYDEKAEAYNRLLRDPLAALIGRITGSGEMPRFTDGL